MINECVGLNEWQGSATLHGRTKLTCGTVLNGLNKRPGPGSLSAGPGRLYRFPAPWTPGWGPNQSDVCHLQAASPVDLCFWYMCFGDAHVGPWIEGRPAGLSLVPASRISILDQAKTALGDEGGRERCVRGKYSTISWLTCIPLQGNARRTSRPRSDSDESGGRWYPKDDSSRGEMIPACPPRPMSFRRADVGKRHRSKRWRNKFC